MNFLNKRHKLSTDVSGKQRVAQMEMQPLLTMAGTHTFLLLRLQIATCGSFQNLLPSPSVVLSSVTGFPQPLDVHART